jgi:site-specific recombinase XerD
MSAAGRDHDFRRSAVQAQIATAIELLITTGIRVSDLAKLDVKENLVRRGPASTIHIFIAAEETRTHRSLDYALLAESTGLVERYLREFRPRLASPLSTALFPGTCSLPKRSRSLGRRISRTIRSHTGMQISAHVGAVLLSTERGSEALL